MLGGGLPVGAITEVIGSACTGRTSFALTFLAEVTRAGQAAAWVDVSDALDPESAAAAELDLNHLLWVRCGVARRTTDEVERLPSEPGLLRESSPMKSASKAGSPHPRNETRGMPEAIQALLQQERWCTSENPCASEQHTSAPRTQNRENPVEAGRRRKKIGTPGMPNCLLVSGAASFAHRILNRVEQPPTDRQPARRGEHFSQQSKSPAATKSYRPGWRASAKVEGKQPRVTTWATLDQAIRATDLLLNAGGFGALVLDLSRTPAEFAERIPLATWFRFRAAAERSRTVVLLLTQDSCARSSAGLVLRLVTLDTHTAGSLLNGRTCEIAVSRQRFDTIQPWITAEDYVFSRHKPPQRERRTAWVQTAAWSPVCLVPPEQKGDEENLMSAFIRKPVAAERMAGAASDQPVSKYSQ